LALPNVTVGVAGGPLVYLLGKPIEYGSPIQGVSALELLGTLVAEPLPLEIALI
jgi:hypothetical protein